MKKKNILLIGAGGHARSCIDVIEQLGEYKIAGLIGLPEQINTSNFGYKIIGTDSDLSLLLNKCKYAFIAVGQMKSSNNRRYLFEKITQIGFKVPSIISNLAYVAPNVVIDRGSIVMHGAVINSGSNIGVNCIINTNALVEHDVTIGSDTHISTGAIVNGGVRVGNGVFIGSGSLIKQGITIGNECIVGMGTRVINNLINGEKLVAD